MTFTGTDKVWRAAELLLLAMLRWALQLPSDARRGLIYVAAGCPTLQVLVFKRCMRYFEGLDVH